MAVEKFGREKAIAERIQTAIREKGGKVLWNDVVSELDRNDVNALNPALAYAKEYGLFYRSLETRTDERGKIQMDLYLTLTNPRSENLTIDELPKSTPPATSTMSGTGQV